MNGSLLLFDRVLAGARCAAALLVFAPAVALASLVVLPAGTKSDTNFPGRDLRNLPSSGAMHCAETCDRTKGCMAWTWVRPVTQDAKGTCWLKDGAPQEVKDRCCLSGLRDTKGKPEPGIDRPGQDYRNFDLPRPEANLCRQACSAERQQCRAWTYVAPGVQGPSARCWLKKSVPNPVTNACCTSGVSDRP